MQDRRLQGAGQGRSAAGAGKKLELGRSRVGAEQEQSWRAGRREQCTYQILPKLYQNIEVKKIRYWSTLIGKVKE